jgi:hypothetical protein
MPLERDDEHERQLDAMRRYVAGLGRPGQPPAHTGDPPRRWPLLAVLLTAVALLAGIGIGLALRPTGRAAAAPSADEPTTTTVAPAAAAASAECHQAVEQANRSLAIAVNVETNLAEHTEYMDQLLHGQISGHEALVKGMPSLIAGAKESAKFDTALADYRRVVDRCRLQAP